MLSIQSRISHESKAVPGVTFVVRTMNKIQRARRDFPIAEKVFEFEEALQEWRSLLPKGFWEVNGLRLKIAALNGRIAAGEDVPATELAEAEEALSVARESADAGDTPAAQRSRALADQRAALIRDEHMKPAVIRAGLVSIEGAQVNGEPVTVASLIASSADFDELLDEIYEACEQASGLTVKQQKNLQSDTTSTGQVATNPTNSSAIPAGA